MELSTQGRFEQAIEEYNRAIELGPQMALAYNERGVAYGELSQLERAIRDFSEAIRLTPHAQVFIPISKY